MSDDRTVHVISRPREDEEIRATISTFKGARYVSLRIFWRPEGADFVPTKRGITISVEDLPELEAAVQALRDAVDEEPASTHRPSREQRYNRERATP